jgi:hypothetical protein
MGQGSPDPICLPYGPIPAGPTSVSLPSKGAVLFCDRGRIVPAVAASPRLEMVVPTGNRMVNGPLTNHHQR